jgi:hypothetical protein
MSGVRRNVAGAPGELAVEVGGECSERLDTAAVLEPVAAPSTRALGVSAPHEASAKIVPASPAHRTIVERSAGIASPKSRASSTTCVVVDSSGIRRPSIAPAHCDRAVDRTSEHLQQ